MLGLKIAAACAVLFTTGCLCWATIREGKPGEKMPGFLAILGLCGILGVPFGLILAIFGV